MAFHRERTCLSIKYLAESKHRDLEIVGIVGNGYPHRSLEELGLDNVQQAYYATKVALWCYLVPGWSIDKVTIAPGLSEHEQQIAERILAATKDILQPRQRLDRHSHPGPQPLARIRIKPMRYRSTAKPICSRCTP